MEINHKFEDKVESIAFGGNGVMRHNNKVVFVPYTAPEDIVKVSITEVKESYAIGKLESIVEPSPQRYEAKCPYFGKCGGCQLQHIKYEYQLEQKGLFISDALKRIAKIEVPEIIVNPCSDRWNYRRHVSLKAVTKYGNISLGFYKHNTNNIVDINKCLIFDNSKLLFPALKELLLQLPFFKPAINVIVMKSSAEAYTVAIQWNGKIPEGIDSILRESVKEEKLFEGIILTNKFKVKKYGNTNCSFKIGQLKINYSPLSFIQSNPQQSLQLYEDILETVKNIKPERVLDLYCGIGTTSLLIANKGYSVTGIENNHFATKLAVQNSKENNIKSAFFVCADVEDVIEKNLNKNYDLVLVNPPRTGMDNKTLEAMCKYKPKHIIYTSCMPSTLARDIKSLKEHGYTIDKIQAYDMFPQTTHVETVVTLRQEV